MKKGCTLAVSVFFILGLSACNPAQKTPTNTALSQAPTASLLSGIDLNTVDTNVRAQDDFFRHTNGSWLRTTEIPADKARFGVFNVIYDDTQENLKSLIQEAASVTVTKGSNTQKLGDNTRAS